MKRNHFLYYIILSSLFFSCTQPIANSLLVNSNKTCDDFTGCTTDTTEGDLGGPTITANLTASTTAQPSDVSDRIEITGTCTDLGRKNNRILVEVYAGEDESARPYIDNTVADTCQPSNNPVKSDLESVFINQKSVVMGLAQTFQFSASGGTLPSRSAIWSAQLPRASRRNRR